MAPFWPFSACFNFQKPIFISTLHFLHSVLILFSRIRVLSGIFYSRRWKIAGFCGQKIVIFHEKNWPKEIYPKCLAHLRQQHQIIKHKCSVRMSGKVDPFIIYMKSYYTLQQIRRSKARRWQRGWTRKNEVLEKGARGDRRHQSKNKSSIMNLPTCSFSLPRNVCLWRNLSFDIFFWIFFRDSQNCLSWFGLSSKVFGKTIVAM